MHIVHIYNKVLVYIVKSIFMKVKKNPGFSYFEAVAKGSIQEKFSRDFGYE